LGTPSEGSRQGLPGPVTAARTPIKGPANRAQTRGVETAGSRVTGS